MNEKETNEPTLQMEPQYLVGLLDYLTRPVLRPTPTNTGYGLKTGVRINLRQSELVAGIVTRFLNNRGVSFRVKYVEETPQLVNITKDADISTLHKFLQEESLQVAKKIAYINHVGDKYHGVAVNGQPELFLKLFKPWAELHPEWNTHTSRKYTLDFFKSEFGIQSITGAEEVPKVEYPEGISKEYVVGAFDAVGSVELHVQKSNEYSIDYSLGPMARMSISNPHTLVIPHFKKFFAETEITPSFSRRDSSAQIGINNAEDIDQLLELIVPHKYYQYEVCQLFYEELIPAYRDGYHHDKAGFLDILRAYEAVTGKPASNEFDVEYFESLWDL